MHLRRSSPPLPGRLGPQVRDVGVLQRVDATPGGGGRRLRRAVARVELPEVGAVQGGGVRGAWSLGGVRTGEGRDGRRRRGDGVPGEPGPGVRMRGRDSGSGVRGSVMVARWVSSGGGGERRRLSSRRVCVGFLLIVLTSPCPLGLAIPPGLVLLPPGRLIFSRCGFYCHLFSAVSGVTGLPVGAMQRERERDSAIAKLTRTDAGRPG